MAKYTFVLTGFSFPHSHEYFSSIRNRIELLAFQLTACTHNTPSVYTSIFPIVYSISKRKEERSHLEKRIFTSKATLQTCTVKKKSQISKCMCVVPYREYCTFWLKLMLIFTANWLCNFTDMYLRCRQTRKTWRWCQIFSNFEHGDTSIMRFDVLFL